MRRLKEPYESLAILILMVLLIATVAFGSLPSFLVLIIIYLTYEYEIKEK